MIDVDYSKDQILEAVQTCVMNGKAEPSDIYGKGDAGRQIAELLASLPLKFHKTITF